MNNTINETANSVYHYFLKHFGRTPIKQRVDDIFDEALEIKRFTDIQHLREEMGDCLCSLLAGIRECGWNPSDLVNDTINKIESRTQQYASLGRKTKVAILGGAFDPITTGHIKNCQFVLNTSKTFDEVWLMPCYKHMNGKKMESYEHRLNMCKLAAEKDPRIKVSDFEGIHKLSGETYQLVKAIEKEKLTENHNFSLIIGQDNANTFDRWVNADVLEQMIRFVVVPRPGVEPEGNWYLKSPHIWLSNDGTLSDVSSTLVREQIRTKGNSSFVDQDVLNYILENKLYQ